MWRGTHDWVGHQDRSSRFLQRNIPPRNSETIINMDWLWLDDDLKYYPYVLNQYYTSAPQNLASSSADAPEEPSELTEHHGGDYWMPPTFTQGERRYEDYWKDHQESIFQHHDVSNVDRSSRSRWWARNSPPHEQSQASFMEPPDFERYALNKHFDNISERSLEEQQQSDWSNFRKLSRTTYMDDFDTGEVDLHFGDVYSRTPRPDSTSFE